MPTSRYPKSPIITTRAISHVQSSRTYLFSVCNKGNQEEVKTAIKDALRWLERIHRRNMLIVSQIGPAITAAALRLGQDPESFHSISSIDDPESNEMLEQRALADVVRLIDQVKSEVPALGRERATLGSDQQEIDRFNARSAPSGRRLATCGEMLTRLGELHEWLETSPDAKWAQALLAARHSRE